MIQRVAFTKILLQQLNRKQASTQNIKVSQDVQKGLRFSQIEKQQLERLRQKQIRGKKISQQVKKIFNEFKTALSSPQNHIEKLQKLKNKILFYDSEIFTGMNILKDAQKEQIYQQIICIMQNENIPQRHKVNIIKLTLFKEIQEKDDAFEFMYDELREDNFLKQLIEGAKETIIFLNKFFVNCIYKVKNFCQWVMSFVEKLFS